MTKARLKQIGVPVFATVLLVGLSACMTLWASRLGLFRAIEFQVYDRWMTRRPSGPPAESPCVLIGLTDPDIDATQYPVSDSTLADLLQKLHDAGAAAIGLDIYRDQPVWDVKTRTDGQARLLKVLHDNGEIIVPMRIGANAADITRPPPTFGPDDDQVGIVNIAIDHDGIVRRGLLSAEDSGGTPRLTLDFKLAATWLALKDAAVSAAAPPTGAIGNGIALGKAVFQPFKADRGPYTGEQSVDDWGLSIPLDFRGPAQFDSFSFRQILAGAFRPDAIKDRITIVGIQAQTVKDTLSTSLRSMYPIEFGNEYHARFVDQLIRAARGSDGLMRFWSAPSERLSVLLFCAIGGAIPWIVRPRGRRFVGSAGTLLSGSLAVAVLAAIWSVAGAAFGRDTWIPAVAPTCGFLVSFGLVTLYNAVAGRGDRNAMRQLIGHYMSSEVADLVWTERDSVFDRGRLVPRRLKGTVLFTDLRGYSGIAERLQAFELMQWLNDYFAGISDRVKEHGGIIIKFNGDQIVSVFGPPRRRVGSEVANDARGAVKCALAMRAALSGLNARWRSANLPEAQMRIGIHTGSLIAGTLGSRERLEWTIIGDAVNIASRLESAQKEFMPNDIAANGCRILVSRATARFLDASFNLRRLGRMQLRGRTASVIVFGVADGPVNTLDSGAGDSITSAAGAP